MKKMISMLVVITALGALVIGCSGADASPASSTYNVEYNVQWAPGGGDINTITYWDGTNVERVPDATGGLWSHEFQITVEEPVPFRANMSLPVDSGRSGGVAIRIFVDGEEVALDTYEPLISTAAKTLRVEHELSW